MLLAPYASHNHTTSIGLQMPALWGPAVCFPSAHRSPIGDKLGYTIIIVGWPIDGSIISPYIYSSNDENNGVRGGGGFTSQGSLNVTITVVCTPRSVGWHCGMALLCLLRFDLGIFLFIDARVGSQAISEADVTCCTVDDCL